MKAAEPLEREEQAHELRLTVLGALLAAIVNAGFLLLDLRSAGLGLPGRLRIAEVALCASVAGLLVVRRSTADRMEVRGAFTLVTLPMLVIFWLDELYMARSGLAWLPFIGPKLVCLAIAFLSPLARAQTFVLIGAFAIASVLEWWLVLADVPQLPSSYEPWATAITGALACAFAWSRHNERALIREVATARAEAASFAALGRASIALRDGIGTPLQTLELELALLARDERCMDVRTARMRRALTKLRSVAGALARYETDVDWRPSLDAFDARALLGASGAPSHEPETHGGRSTR